MERNHRVSCFLALSGLALALLPSLAAAESYSWRYYRPGNTGIQGDDCQAVWLDPQGNPWISGFDASFEEGGIAKLNVAANAWTNVSNIDYPVIGHPDLTGVARVSDIDVDSNGGMWMATGHGSLYYHPQVGPSSLRRFGDDNSPMPSGWNRGVEVAPDGTVWFSAYSTVWGDGGVTQFNPQTSQWRVFPDHGDGSLAIQPKPGGGYYVYTTVGYETERYDTTTDNWTLLNESVGNPAYIVGNNATDAQGNLWIYQWTDATYHIAKLGCLRPDGTWINVPPAPFDYQTNSAAALRPYGAGKLVAVDGGGTAYRYDGSAWESLGMPYASTYMSDIDIDANGNVWVVGLGGASVRNAASGEWQRYRITATSQYDLFNNDLTLAPDGRVFACANAAPGYGGMVEFDGSTWTGHNQFTYGLGQGWPFNGDNSFRLMARSNGNIVVNPMFEFLHEFDGAFYTDLGFSYSSPKALVEDSTNRIWAGQEGVLFYRNGLQWVQVENVGATKLFADPVRPGYVWAYDSGTFTLTNGTVTVSKTIEDFPQIDPYANTISGVAVRPDGKIWIGVNNAEPNKTKIILYDINTNQSIIQDEETSGQRIPGEMIYPLLSAPDGTLWAFYDSDYLTATRGIISYNRHIGAIFPAPPGGEPQWGGLPHASIYDAELRQINGGYEIWFICASRGIAVLSVTNPARTLGRPRM